MMGWWKRQVRVVRTADSVRLHWRAKVHPRRGAAVAAVGAAGVHTLRAVQRPPEPATTGTQASQDECEH